MERPAWTRRGTFSGITDGWWRHITAPYLAAGWSLADLTYAADHLPDGTPRWQTRTVTTPGHRGGPARLLLWRLRPWNRPDGAPGPSITAIRDGQRRAERAARERDDARYGITARGARLRALYGREYVVPDTVGSRPGNSRAAGLIVPPERSGPPAGGPERPARRLTGWAVVRYGPEAAGGPAEPPGGGAGTYDADPGWQALLDASAAAATAADAGDHETAAAAQAEVDRLLAARSEP